jgi:hypothetical protein
VSAVSAVGRLGRLGRSWRVPVLAVLVVLAGLVAWPRPSAAEGVTGFGASSSAFGARVTLTISKAPLVPNIVDGGGPLAQTTLDSLGTSLSLASFPYPGDVVLNLPGLVAGLGPSVPALVSGVPGLVGSNIPGLPPQVLDLLSQIELPGELVAPLVAAAPPLPAYPFAAQADGLTPHQEVDLGVGTLTADASPSAVHAAATSEPGASGAQLAPLSAVSDVRQADDGSVVATATGSITGLRLGPLVIGSVTSSATMSRDADGKVAGSSSFRVSAIQVGSLSVDLTSDGFSIGGSPVPAPVSATINSVLSALGLQMRILPEVRTASAVVAAGLELVRDADFGPLGTGTLSIVLGQSSARLDNAVAGPAPAAPGVEVPVALPSSDGSDGSSFGDGGVSALTPSPTGPVARSGSDQPGTDLRTVRTAAAEPFDAKGIYLLLILAAAVIVGVGPILRLLPRRAPTPE